MKNLIIFSIALLSITSCNKRLEKAARISGVWNLEETVITSYVNNEAVEDSVVEQSGDLLLETTGGYENQATTDIPFAPCLEFCFWEIPKRKADQIFFSFHDESSLSIYSESCMIEKSTSKKLVILKVNYDNELNIYRTIRWKFKKGKL